MREALTPALRDDLRTAIAGCMAETTPIHALPDRRIEAVLAEISAFMKLTGGGWPPEHRQEFQDQILVELADMPAAIAVENVRVARQRVWDPKRFLSWVIERAEPAVQKLNTELTMLNRLSDIANS